MAVAEGVEDAGGRRVASDEWQEARKWRVASDEWREKKFETGKGGNSKMEIRNWKAESQKQDGHLKVAAT